MSGRPWPPVSLLVCCKVSQPPGHAGAGPRGEGVGASRGDHTASSRVCLQGRQTLIESEPACLQRGLFPDPGWVPLGLSQVSRSVGILRSQGPHHTETVEVSPEDKYGGVVPGLALVLWLVTAEATVSGTTQMSRLALSFVTS